MYFTLSWRNIWRSKRRTLIAAASVFFAVLLAVVMRSSQIGSYAYMIHSSAKLYSGYLQVQGQGYWDDRSLDKSIVVPADQQAWMRTLPHVASVTPRLEGVTLASCETATKVAQVIGIVPELEDQMTGLKRRLTSGNYLSADSPGALMAEGLAEMLGVTVGDSLVLYGQGYHGQLAAANVPIIGIVKLPFQEMNNGMVYLALPTAQELFSAPDRLTSIAIMLEDSRFLDHTLAALQTQFGQDYALLTWHEMLPDLKQSIQLDNASGLIMLVILYIVIAFGVFGTIMMMASERLKEFGMLVAVGMRKWRLMLVTTIETILIALVGVLAGILGSIPLVWYLHTHPIRFTGDATRMFDQLGIEPIFMFSSAPTIFVNQVLMVLLIAFISAIYPLVFIRRLDPHTALHA